jgi:hypothetical protein
MRDRIAGIRRYQGFSHEVIHRGNDQRVVDVVSCRDRPGRFERENACEYRQPAQDGPLKLVQQVIAPVERGCECLMARQRGASTAPKQPEPLIEQRRHSPDAVRTNAARGKFDRERDPIQLSADFGHDRRIRIAERKSRLVGGRAFAKKQDRWKGQCLFRREIGVLRRALERGQLMNLLALDT